MAAAAAKLTPSARARKLERAARLAEQLAAVLAEVADADTAADRDRFGLDVELGQRRARTVCATAIAEAVRDTVRDLTHSA